MTSGCGVMLLVWEGPMHWHECAPTRWRPALAWSGCGVLMSLLEQALSAQSRCAPPPGGGQPSWRAAVGSCCSLGQARCTAFECAPTWWRPALVVSGCGVLREAWGGGQLRLPKPRNRSLWD